MTSWRTIFGCDLRTLALFRVGLGVALLIDLLSRARDFRAHYTLFGAVPPLPQGTPFLVSWVEPFLNISWVQAGLFFFDGLAALAVLVGYRTRLATIIGWCLLNVIQIRNPLVSQGGDLLLRLLYFWAIFLPIGARYSVDAALDLSAKKEPSNAHFSMGTLAILLQVACLYFFSAFLKSDPEWMPEGTALYYALHLESLVLPFGRWLREFHEVVQGLTYFTWGLELIGPILLFSPWLFLPLRILMVTLFGLLHLGIVVCMNVGLFPLMNFVSLVPFIPAWVWDSMKVRLQKSGSGELAIFYDQGCDGCRKLCLLLRTFLMLPSTPIHPAQSDSTTQAMMGENAYVVRDARGQYYGKWDAVVVLVSHSPVFSMFGKLLSFSFMKTAGAWLSGNIESHRGKLSCLFERVLPYRDYRLYLPRTMEVIVGLLVVYMVFINIATSPILPGPIPDPIALVKKGLRINQKWNMFAPHPRKKDGWLVIFGRLVDGTDVDLYNLRSTPPVFKDSSFEHYPYANYRWRKYLHKIVVKKGKYARPSYGRYLCNRWNESHPPLQQVRFLEVYFFKVQTPPPDSTAASTEPKPFSIFKYSCLKHKII